MANHALGAQQLPGPQPIAKQGVACETQVATESLIKTGGSEVADGIFRYATMACGLCVLALVSVIVYQLVTTSTLSWHAFGWKFFFRSEWDPVNDQYGAFAIRLRHHSFFDPWR